MEKFPVVSYILLVLLFAFFMSKYYHNMIGRAQHPYVVSIIAFAVIAGLILYLGAPSKENFYFETSKDRWRCNKGGYIGKPISFEYTSDADRSKCPTSISPTSGWDGFLGQRIYADQTPNCCNKKHTYSLRNYKPSTYGI